MERVTASGVVTHDDYLQDRLVSTSSATGATVNKYLHDHAGRLTSKRTAAGAETEGFAHDIQDQLRQVRRGGAVTEKLEYDRPDRRAALPDGGEPGARRAATTLGKAGVRGVAGVGLGMLEEATTDSLYTAIAADVYTVLFAGSGP